MRVSPREKRVSAGRFYTLVTYDLIAKQNKSFHAQGLLLYHVCVCVCAVSGP